MEKRFNKVAVTVFCISLFAIFFAGFYLLNDKENADLSGKAKGYNIDCANTVSVAAKSSSNIYDESKNVKVFKDVSNPKTAKVANETNTKPAKTANADLNISSLESSNGSSDMKIEQTAKKKKKKKVKYYSTGSASLNKSCDKILNKIIKPSMSQRSKANAIYNWVSRNIRYSGSSTTDAKKILRTRRGNCKAFCYGSKALLTRVGIKNKVVKGNNGHHYWNMVKVNGSWYHFDTIPGWGKKRFLWTNKQMKKYRYKKLRYRYNASNYPATPR